MSFSNYFFLKRDIFISVVEDLLAGQKDFYTTDTFKMNTLKYRWCMLKLKGGYVAVFDSYR